MMSADFAIHAYRTRLPGIVRWAAVALYTAALPYVIFIFQYIDRYFPSTITGRVPLLIIVFFAVAYTILSVKHKTAARCFVILGVSAVIVFGIMMVEPNRNKHIHIPEYVLMTWLLHWALGAGYKGSGLFLLIFICAVMLGFVDELLQGIHPERYYGWLDMIINAASAFIGILMLMGAKRSASVKEWSWAGRFRDYKATLAVILFGAVTAVLMGIRLFDVQLRGAFNSIYPQWLLIGDAVFLASGAAVIICHWHGSRVCAAIALETHMAPVDGRSTVRLWIFPPLAILMAMHALVLWAVVAGLNFR